MWIRCVLVSILLLTLAACGQNENNLKTIQQQTAGDYTVTLLSADGTIKQGANSFFLEFRKSAGKELTDVGTIEVAPVMEMAGMSPMMASAEAAATATPGRYKITSGLTMAGLWKCKVSFANGQSVRFNLNAE